MGISATVASWLKSSGHEAMHLNDEGLNYLSDDLIIEKAINEHRVILTSDMDFGQLLTLNHIQQVSIVQFRVSNFKSHYIIEKLELLFKTLSGQLTGAFIVTITDDKIRIRYLDN